MTEYVVPAAVIGLLGLAFQGTLAAIKLARGFLAERNGNGTSKHGRALDIASTVLGKLDAIVDVAVLNEKLSAIDRRLTGVHDSVHDLRDGLQPLATQLALHEHRIKSLEDARK